MTSKPKTTTRKTTTKRATVKKTTTKKTTTKKTTTKKTSTKNKVEKKSRTNLGVNKSALPLSFRTWRLLHVKAVGSTIEGGMGGLGGEVAECIKKKVFEFLGPVPAGVMLITDVQKMGLGTNNRYSATMMHIISTATGRVEMECTIDVGNLGCK